MICAMPRKLPPFVTMDRSRHGTIRFYFRRRGRKTRLPHINDPSFGECYAQALKAAVPPPAPKPNRHSLEWLLAQYRGSSKWLSLSTATRRQRDNIFTGVLAKGNPPYHAIGREHIVKGREDRAGTPAQARNFLDAMRGLFRWALEAQHVAADPTEGVTNPPRQKGPGFPIWTAAEVEAYRSRWPLGTLERVWLEVLIGTGARRGDAVTIGRQHIKNGMIALETQKEGVWAYIPVLSDMRRAIDAGPTGDLTFIVGHRGGNLTKESFGNFFRKACNAAGIKKSAHGLRKYAATAYAEEGLSEAELETVFGWVRGSSMAAHYSRNAERQRISRGAAQKLGLSHLDGKVSHRPKKVK